MRVTVSLLGGLRHYAEGEEVHVLDLAPGLTAGELADRFGIPRGEVLQVLADGRRVEPADPIGDCREVSVLPILVGG